MVEDLNEFRGISCHPVNALGDPDDHVGPFGIRLVAGTEDRREHFLRHIYAELFDRLERQDISIVSDTGVRFMRHEDRCTIILDYGIGDAVALPKVASEAMEYMGVKDVGSDKSVRGLANAQPNGCG